MTKTKFETRFDRAYEASRRRSGLATLAALRTAFPELSREEFNAELRTLRAADRYDLVAHEGTHGRSTAEERAAEIIECESRYRSVRRLGD